MRVPQTLSSGVRRHTSPLMLAAVLTLTGLQTQAQAQAQAQAQSFPSKPISLLVGYSPGGSVDLAARTIAPELGKRLGQVVNVENIGGAGGQLATQRAVSAVADGHTLLLGTSAEIAVARHVSPTVKYDASKDLTVLGLIGTQPMVLTSGVKVPHNTIQELTLAIKQQPGKFSYGSAGNASLPHLAGELFKQRSGSYAVHIPYRGATPMLADLLGGQIELGMLVLSSAMGPIKGGRLKAFAVTEAKRSALLPDVPALAEIKGMEGFDVSVFFAVFAPQALPEAARGPLERALASTLAEPSVQAALQTAGFTLRAADPRAATAFIQDQERLYRRIIEQSKIKE
jgi:tripartite-type tricarboxylate transporter receptor subunit TctC